MKVLFHKNGELPAKIKTSFVLSLNSLTTLQDSIKKNRQFFQRFFVLNLGVQSWIILRINCQ